VQPAVPSALPRYFVLIPCGGTGSRAGAGLPKQYRVIAGQPLLAHTLVAFAAVPELAAVLVGVSPQDSAIAQAEQACAAARALAKPPFKTPFLIAANAGETRSATVLNGLSALLTQHGAQPTDWVLVHDAARCLITTDQINALVQACANDAVGGLLAQPLADTLKQSVQGRVAATVERSDKWLAQTPQMFRIGALQAALLHAQAAGVVVTDEASAMEAMGLQPLLVVGSAQNFKVTYPEDFALAEACLRGRTV
jgi:2-C-methyl-D-erythritol 4-phosphate cytidylyltransferase